MPSNPNPNPSPDPGPNPNPNQVQLAGAMAAWELATDKSHHDRITDDFLLALQA